MERKNRDGCNIDSEVPEVSSDLLSKPLNGSLKTAPKPSPKSPKLLDLSASRLVRVRLRAREIASGGAQISHQRLHRLATARHRQGITLEQLAQQMNAPVDKIAQEEDEARDLRLSALYRWGEILGLPITELVVEREDPLEQHREQVAKLQMIWRMAQSLTRQPILPPERRLIGSLIRQLDDLLTDLHETPKAEKGATQFLLKASRVAGGL